MQLEQEYFALTEQKRQLTKQLDEVKDKLAQIEEALLTWLESNELGQIKSDHGTIFIRTEMYASIKDQEKAFGWLESNQMGDVIKRTVHAKTLATLVKENGDIPGVESSVVQKIGFRSSGKGELVA